MTAESAEDRRQQWVLVVRRAFGVPDSAGNEDARRALIVCFEEQLQVNGWKSARRAIAEPMMDALLVLGAKGDLDDYLISVEMHGSAGDYRTRDAAHRIIDRGISVVDPEHLTIDAMSEYPPEVVATVQQLFERVSEYAREPRFGD
jgi:hypothetical protein